MFLPKKVLFSKTVSSTETEASQFLLTRLIQCKLVGENVFHNNTADRGAGLALYLFIVHLGSFSTTFVSNTANKYGGAIHLLTLATSSYKSNICRELAKKFAFTESYSVSATSEQCFYSSDCEAKVIFNNNTPEFGGTDVFGVETVDRQCRIVKYFTDLTL